MCSRGGVVREKPQAARMHATVNPLSPGAALGEIRSDKSVLQINPVLVSGRSGRAGYITGRLHIQERHDGAVATRSCISERVHTCVGTQQCVLMLCSVHHITRGFRIYGLGPLECK